MADITVILITGVSQGIGLRMAEICLERPNHVVIGSIRDDSTPAVKELQQKTPAEGSRLLLVHIESTAPGDPKTAAAAVAASGIDHVDIIIANAGASPMPVLPIETVPNEDLVWAFQTNAAGPLGLFQAFRHLLQKSKSPKWASITSTGGSISLVGPMKSYIVTAYGMSKAAQNYMTQALAHSQQEWLTVLDIHPGHSRTGPGNWVARQIGMEQAPLTIDESANAVLETVLKTTREAALGKIIYAIDGSVMPW
ncbi:Uu.00g133650.m01.CDS01 [Anthostomella pinea]|uniref:Uu.00g133650.m01.CDS01 n=1 Tax=Anthostomella pinea TaxID=933095 RepID=A0AAI8YIC1_9PEZI|nr:Uu.00g133650.m01.CDS01 [Anthostomella pinea]